MKISELVIGIIIFIGLITGMGIFYGDLAATYGKTDVQNLSFINSTYNMTNFYTNLQSNITKDWGIIGSFYTSISIVTGALTQLLQFPEIFINFINDVTFTASEAGVPIPPWFLNVLIGVVTVTIIFLIIGFFTDREV